MLHHGVLHFTHAHGYLFAAAVFEFQSQGEGFAHGQRLFQIHQHHVVAAGFELLGFAGGQRDAVFDFAHFHHAIFIDMGVQLGAAGNGGLNACADKDVVFFVGIFQVDKHTAGILAFNSGACISCAGLDAFGHSHLAEQGCAERQSDFLHDCFLCLDGKMPEPPERPRAWRTGCGFAG